MRKLNSKDMRFQRRRNRSKRTLAGQTDRMRLVVFRSNKHIRAQIVDDLKGETLVSAASVDTALAADMKNADSKIAQSRLVGIALAERALKKKVKKVIFDRNGYPYHGRIKAVADGARETGLEF
ncbi:MAG: 50S ribosomal protein L18 [Candidatus Neomarinimicrobiota bacterium]